MATCKDCIHYDICTFNLTGNENEKCPHFLDKADVVEVVRCKDCKSFVENKEARVTYFRRELKNLTVKPNDFCSCGERSRNE